MAEVPGDLPHAAAGQVKDGPGMRHQRRAGRPGLGQCRAGGDGIGDQGGGAPPLPGQLGGYLGLGFPS